MEPQAIEKILIESEEHSDNIVDLKKEFYEVIKPIATHKDVIAMKNIAQHSQDNNRYDHSMYVAYISFLICRKLGLDAHAAARGGLLHDFEFISAIPTRPHPVKLLFTHPKKAVNYATSIFSLSNIEVDIIKTHMWPMTIWATPKYTESFIVSCVDKYCATIEFAGQFDKTKSARVIEAFA